MMQTAVGQAIKSGVAWIGWRVPRPIGETRVILLYHGTPRSTLAGRVDESAFSAHIQFLKQHVEFITPQEFTVEHGGRRPRVLLTFDDGFRNNYEIARPILQSQGIPAVFFVCVRPTQPGKVLWFAYLRALEDYYSERTIHFRGERFPMQAGQRRSSMRRLTNLLLGLQPHPQAMYRAIEDELPPLADFMTEERILDVCAGMNAEQILNLAQDPLFTVGCHTVDHPFLTRCTPDEGARQIAENKVWLERLIGGKQEEVAYPSGDYNARILAHCGALGFRRGYAVIPSERASEQLELPRIGIYGTSLDTLGFVVRWGSVMRSMRITMG